MNTFTDKCDAFFAVAKSITYPIYSRTITSKEAMAAEIDNTPLVVNLRKQLCNGNERMEICFRELLYACLIVLQYSPSIETNLTNNRGMYEAYISDNDIGDFTIHCESIYNYKLDKSDPFVFAYISSRKDMMPHSFKIMCTHLFKSIISEMWVADKALYKQCNDDFPSEEIRNILIKNEDGMTREVHSNKTNPEFERFFNGILKEDQSILDEYDDEQQQWFHNVYRGLLALQQKFIQNIPDDNVKLINMLKLLFATKTFEIWQKTGNTGGGKRKGCKNNKPKTHTNISKKAKQASSKWVSTGRKATVVTKRKPLSTAQRTLYRNNSTGELRVRKMAARPDGTRKVTYVKVRDVPI